MAKKINVRRKALKLWIEGREKKPTIEEAIAFKTGFNMCWNMRFKLRGGK